MTDTTTIRQPKGQPSGGQFAAHAHTDAAIALHAASPNGCAICGHIKAEASTDPNDPTLCLPCGNEAEWYWCRVCDELTEEDGEGWDGMCGNCADESAAGDTTCAECGGEIRLNDDETAQHLNEEGEIDHGLDAEHTPVPERDYIASVPGLTPTERRLAEYPSPDGCAVCGAPAVDVITEGNPITNATAGCAAHLGQIRGAAATAERAARAAARDAAGAQWAAESDDARATADDLLRASRQGKRSREEYTANERWLLLNSELGIDLDHIAAIRGGHHSGAPATHISLRERHPTGGYDEIIFDAFGTAQFRYQGVRHRTDGPVEMKVGGR